MAVGSAGQETRVRSPPSVPTSLSWTFLITSCRTGMRCCLSVYYSKNSLKEEERWYSAFYVVLTNPINRPKLITSWSYKWYGLFLCAKELHCCLKTFKKHINEPYCCSGWHFTLLSQNTSFSLFRWNPTYTVLLLEILTRALKVYESTGENSPH